MMSNRYGLYELGYTRTTMGNTKNNEYVNKSKFFKTFQSSNCSLHLENMKMESLVIVSQHITVNVNMSFVQTARHALGVYIVINNSITNL